MKAYALLKDWYDRYHFSKSMVDVYNPFSVINALARLELSDYWYQTGAPTILIKTIKEHSLNIAKLGHITDSKVMVIELRDQLEEGI